jgi:gluconolactonase
MLLAIFLTCLQDVEKVAGDMKFTEGPVADASGHVYFTDIPNNRIMKWDGSKLSTWREKSGGANGLRFDKDGSLVVCEGGNRRVTRITPDQKVTVLADSYNGKKLNSPNDLCIDSKGGIYFTDPRYGNRRDLEQDKEAVYYIPPSGGKIVRVIDDFVRPNGIDLYKDRLFVADHGGGKVYVYSVQADGTLKDKKVFCEVASDGLKCDDGGRLYTTTGKGVEVFEPDGKPLRVIKVPETPANLCFSGKTLYITARTSLYLLR